MMNLAPVNTRHTQAVYRDPRRFNGFWLRHFLNLIDTCLHTRSVMWRLSKNPGVDKGPQPLMALFGFGDMCGKSAKSACAARLSLHSVLAAP